MEYKAMSNNTVHIVHLNLYSTWPNLSINHHRCPWWAWCSCKCDTMPVWGYRYCELRPSIPLTIRWYVPVCEMFAQTWPPIATIAATATDVRWGSVWNVACIIMLVTGLVWLPDTFCIYIMLVVVEVYALLEPWGCMIVIAILETAVHIDTVWLDEDDVEVRFSAEIVRCESMDICGLIMFDMYDNVIWWHIGNILFVILSREVSPLYNNWLTYTTKETLRGNGWIDRRVCILQDMPIMKICDWDELVGICSHRCLLSSLHTKTIPTWMRQEFSLG